jgi:hypothetical protein
MPFEVSWYLGDRIILVKATGAIKDVEVEELDKKVTEFIDSSQSPRVHFIYDGTLQTKTPSTRALLNFKSPKHPKFGWGVNPIVRFATTVVVHATNAHYRMLPTLADAEAFLAEVDQPSLVQ